MKKISTTSKIVNKSSSIKDGTDITTSIVFGGALEYYDPEKLPEHFAMLICAPRRSGKTHLLKYMLYAIKDQFEYAYLFSATANLQDDNYDFIPKSNRYDSF